jgi:hypothetical protein
MGGFAHLATDRALLRATRPGALLLDGGDTWQGSATSLWTRGQDMIDAQKRLGVDVMTGHWEFTYGADRVKEVVDKEFAGKIDFVAQNVKTTDFGDPCSSRTSSARSTACRWRSSARHFPYTPIANPRYFVNEWTFGIQEDEMQKVVDEARAKGARVVVLLSHNGMDVDLKLASRVTGHRRDPRRPHARRRAAAYARRQSQRQDARHQRGQQRQVHRRARPRRAQQPHRRLSLSPGAGVQQPAAGRSRHGRHMSRACASLTPRSSTRSSPRPRRFSTGAATSTARSTSSSATP